MTIKINNVPVEDTFAEAFTMYMGRILVTAVTQRWALAAVQEAKGLGVSATMGPGEAGIECEVNVSETPDKRPGYILQVGHAKKKELNYWLMARIRKGLIPVPTTSIFDEMPKHMVDYFVEIKGTPIQLFGDGYEELVNVYGRTMYKIPRMDGFFYIETKLGVTRGVAGGNFLILAESQPAGLLAGGAAFNAIKEIPYVWQFNPGGIASSGTKVGGKVYKNAIATTNDKYCACLVDKVKDTKIHPGVNCVYEVLINGLNLESVKKAMEVGIEAATSAPGVKMITAGNYGGTLGNIPINLYDVLC